MNNSRDTHIQIAYDALAENNLSKALIHLQLITNNKNDYDALYLLAQVKLLLGQAVTFKNKIGFLVNWQMHIDQFCNIWKHLPRDSYEIVLQQHSVESSCPIERYYNPTREYLVEHNLPFVDLSECIRNLITFEVLMTAGYSNAAFPELNYSYKIAKHHARIMSQGFQNHNFSGITKYDYLLLQGYNQVNQVYDAGFKGDAFVVGYPRFDNYFDPKKGPLSSTLASSLKLDTNKKTILWTPTHYVHSSLHYYAESMALLTKSHNILLKPHLDSFSDASESIILQKLESCGVIIIRSSFEDSSLFKVADYVCVDYGGAVFSSLYLGKKTVLLIAPAELHSIFPCHNSEDLTDKVPSIHRAADAYKAIIDLLNDDELWETQKHKTSLLKKHYFAPFDGISGKISATVLLKIVSE